jgi:hypothetical protein
MRRTRDQFESEMKLIVGGANGDDERLSRAGCVGLILADARKASLFLEFELSCAILRAPAAEDGVVYHEGILFLQGSDPIYIVNSVTIEEVELELGSELKNESESEQQKCDSGIHCHIA